MRTKTCPLISIMLSAVTPWVQGSFENGQVFDTSRQAGREPFKLRIGAGQVIKGTMIYFHLQCDTHTCTCTHTHAHQFLPQDGRKDYKGCVWGKLVLRPLPLGYGNPPPPPQHTHTHTHTHTHFSEVRKLVIPPHLAYGEQGVSGAIPRTFDVVCSVQ